MSEDLFDQEVKAAFATPQLPTNFVEGVIEDIQREQRASKRRWVAAASILVLLGGLSWMLWPAKLRIPFPQVMAVLHEGALGVAAAPGEPWMAHAANEPFVLAVNNDLRAEHGSLARLGIENLGILTLERESQAEVRSMDWKQFGSGAALGAITVGVIVGAVEWRSGGKAQRAVAGEELKLEASDASMKSGEIASWSKEKQDLLAKLDQAQARVTELEKKTSRAPVAVEPSPELAKAPEIATPAKKLAARFGDPELQKVLDEVDWDKTGEAMKNLIPLIDQLTEAFENDKPLPESVAELQKWNADLVSMALKFVNAGVPGTGINGSFTHPTAAANQIYASLAKIGQPLDESQQASLDTITRRLASEDHARLAGYGDDTLALQKLFEEASLKDRFFEEAGRLLTPQQQAALYPSRNQGRTNADLYSTGVLWGPCTRGLPIKDRADFEGQIQEDYARRFKLDDAGKAQLQSIVRDWSAKSVSDATLGYVPDKLGYKGMHKTDKVKAAAEQQIALQKQILAKMNLTASQKKALMQDPKVWLPFLDKN